MGAVGSVGFVNFSRKKKCYIGAGGFVQAVIG